MIGWPIYSIISNIKTVTTDVLFAAPGSKAGTKRVASDHTRTVQKLRKEIQGLKAIIKKVNGIIKDNDEHNNAPIPSTNALVRLHYSWDQHHWDLELQLMKEELAIVKRKLNEELDDPPYQPYGKERVINWRKKVGSVNCRDASPLIHGAVSEMLGNEMDADI